MSENAGKFLMFAALAGGAWFYSRQSHASILTEGYNTRFTSEEPAPINIYNSWNIDSWLLDPFASFDDNYGYDMRYPIIFDSPNINALLRTIIFAEGSAKGGRDPYTTVYGYGFTIDNFSAHPYMLGWPGVKLPDEYCEKAGFGPGCISTAAGAYQITIGTYRELGMTNFEPVSQDLAGIALLQKTGAYNLAVNGDIVGAIKRASKRWASLPSSNSGQPQVAMNNLLAYFKESGGVTA